MSAATKARRRCRQVRRQNHRHCGNFDQWRDVQPEFSDHVGQTVPRDFDGTGGMHYTNLSGRNDFASAQSRPRHEEDLFLRPHRCADDAAGGHELDVAAD